MRISDWSSDVCSSELNVGDERSISYWMETAPAIDAPPLPSNASCDVIVIGSGIAGLSTAYELSRFGCSVIVIDRGAVGRGMTARTTAHPPTELDDFRTEEHTSALQALMRNSSAAVCLTKNT